MAARSSSSQRITVGQPLWCANSIDACSTWYYRLPDAGVRELEETLADFRRKPCDITSYVTTDRHRTACQPLIEAVRSALEAGRGFAIIDRLPIERYSLEEARLAYWLLGQALGEPFQQNVQGTLLYDVRDTGQSVAEGARFSVTNYESSFHTDNSFGREVLDYVGLLCLKTAQSGGVSQVVSGYAVMEELRSKQPDVLEILRQPFHMDRRGGTHEGESPTIQFPVVLQHGTELLWRYLRYWIETGHQKASKPLTADQQNALDILDGVLGQPEFRVEFALEPGQIFFINNRWILHNRTAFQDHADPSQRRHLMRLWLRAPFTTDPASVGT